MKYGLIVLLSLVIDGVFAQQKVTFDVVTFTAPVGWTEASTKDVVSYVTSDNQKGTYCRLAIYASTNSKGNLKADFDSEWQELVVKPYKPTKHPELVPSKSDDGWEAQGGVAPFDFSGGQSIAMLVTMSGYERCISIVILTNTEAYQSEIVAFLESVDLKKPETMSQPVSSSSGEDVIVGSWRMNVSDQSSFRVNNGVVSSIFRQYVFHANGTYTFTSKTFDPLMDKILFGKEQGTYQKQGNALMITPQKSVLQAWSKKNGTSDYGELLVSENRPLEKVKYTFTKHYFSGTQTYSLVLQVEAPTTRDGTVSNNTTFTNAYYYNPTSLQYPLIDLPPGDR
jgi:hypothetical protein